MMQRVQMGTIMRRLIVLLLLSIFSLPLLARTYYYTAHMQRPHGVVDFKVWVDGQKARYETASSTDPALPAGVVVITLDGGKTINLIPASKARILRGTAEEFLAANRMRVAKAGVTIQNVTNHALPAQVADSILGYPTLMYEFDIAFDLVQNGKSDHVTVRQRFWVAAALPSPNPMLRMVTNNSVGVPELDRILDANQLLMQGMPMRRDVVITLDGRTLESTLQVGVFYPNTPVDPKLFDIPATLPVVSLTPGPLAK